MGVAEAMIIGGGAMSIYGNYQANEAEAKALRANKRLFEQEATLTLEAAHREQDLFDMESEQFFGSQVNAFAKGGVELSGSALLYLAGTKQQMANESANILETGKRTANLSLLRAQQAGNEAKRLTSFENQFTQAATIGLGTGARIAERGPRSSSTGATIANSGPAAGSG